MNFFLKAWNSLFKKSNSTESKSKSIDNIKPVVEKSVEQPKVESRPQTKVVEPPKQNKPKNSTKKLSTKPKKS